MKLNEFKINFMTANLIIDEDSHFSNVRGWGLILTTAFQLKNKYCEA